MQIATTTRYHLTLTRMATIKNNKQTNEPKKQKITRVDEDVGKLEPLCTVDGIVQ